MKIIIISILISILFLVGCSELDLNPLSEGSSANWYSNDVEISMAIYDLYRLEFWPEFDKEWTDDHIRRSALTPITTASVTGVWEPVNTFWTNSYKAIARANTILLNLENAKETIPQATLDMYTGNAQFVRASQYARLISLYGDVIYYTNILDLEESFTLAKTSKEVILQAIYDDYDAAIEKLPKSYGSSENKLATQGAALAMKARIALYMEDWDVARDAAKACIDLEEYELFDDYETLFLSSTVNPKEQIFGIPRSKELGVYIDDVRYYIPRNVSGYGGSKSASWELLCSYLCTDGLPIDKSPLYNPREPFKNRDPRCSATIVEFQTPWLGFMYQPHPDTFFVMNFNTGEMVPNRDTRVSSQYASYNGLMRKKGVSEEWLLFYGNNDFMIMRYADVLLMYAEAKIELGEIDQSALDAINKVRSRAYKVDYNDTGVYPAVTTTNQAELRTILRMERRMELAFEGVRYMDIIRWRIAEKVFNSDVYGMLDVAELRTKVIKKDLWFFPMTPVIDEDGIPDLSPMYDAGLVKRLAIRKFDASKQYLWPIPTKEILINDNLVQNPGY